MDIQIREMTKDDICSVAVIEKESFSMPWSEKAFEESLSYDHALFLVAEDKKNNETVGYIGMYKVFNQADITNIAVMSRCRGRGIGRALMEKAFEYAVQREVSNMMLEVRVSNKVAIELYEKMGFKRAGIRKNFYEAPVEDAIVMFANLDGNGGKEC